MLTECGSCKGKIRSESSETACSRQREVELDAEPNAEPILGIMTETQSARSRAPWH